jgi:hypothetical protein
MSGLKTAITGSLAGALAGALAAFVVNLLWTRWTRWRLKCGLKLVPQARVGTRACVRIHNSYIFPMNSAFAYITIDHKISDILDPPSGAKAFIMRQHECQVSEDRLCWSVTKNGSNPAEVDIYPGERQSLDVANFGSGWIEFPSESGWGSTGATSRVFLRSKRYSATIKIVSKDARAKSFKIAVDPDKVESAITLI